MPPGKRRVAARYLLVFRQEDVLVIQQPVMFERWVGRSDAEVKPVEQPDVSAAKHQEASTLLLTSLMQREE